MSDRRGQGGYPPGYVGSPEWDLFGRGEDDDEYQEREEEAHALGKGLKPNLLEELLTEAHPSVWGDIDSPEGVVDAASDVVEDILNGPHSSAIDPSDYDVEYGDLEQDSVNKAFKAGLAEALTKHLQGNPGIFDKRQKRKEARRMRILAHLPDIDDGVHGEYEYTVLPASNDLSAEAEEQRYLRTQYRAMQYARHMAKSAVQALIDPSIITATLANTRTAQYSDLVTGALANMIREEANGAWDKTLPLTAYPVDEETYKSIFEAAAEDAVAEETGTIAVMAKAVIAKLNEPAPAGRVA